MGSLSNLYISQSYQSLIHLGTNNALVSGTMTQLQDGLGNSLNISFDGTNISSSGNIYAANLTGSGASINTGSFATTGSNTFFGQETFNGNLVINESGSAFGDALLITSGRLRVDTIGNYGSDLNISAGGGVGDLNLSNVYGGNSIKLQLSGINSITGDTELTGALNITGTLTSSLQQGYVWVGDASGKTVTVATSSFSTIASGSVPAGTISGSAQITALGFVSSSVTASSLITASVSGQTMTFTKGNGTTFNVTLPAGSGSIIDTGSFATTGSNTFNGSQIISTGSILRVDEIRNAGPGEDITIAFDSGADLYINMTNSSIEGVHIDGGLYVTNNLQLTGSLTASLQQGYVWVGDSSGKTVTVATSSFAGGGTTNTGSLLVTASVNNDDITFTKGDGSQFTIQVATGSFAISASYAETASFALNGGVTQILAGPNITVSPLSGQGQVTISSTGTGSGNFNTATGSYGSFYDTTTQINPVANSANSMSFNETAITNGVSISGSTNPFNTYIKTENAGVYNLQFSAQLDKTDSGTDSVDIWIRKNGIDLLDTGTTVTLTGNNDKSVAAWNWFVQSAANDYYQIIWSSADTDLRLLAEVSSSVHPGIPSVIATVNRVDQFLSNTGSFSGSFTGTFNGYNLTEFTTTSSFNSYTSSNDQKVNSLIAATGSYATTGSNTFTGDQTLIDNGGNFFTITDTSGSMMLVGKSYTSASAHLSSSVPSPSGSLLNLIFKTNNNTADTIISGSNNIFTNPTAAVAGFKRYIGGSNNIINSLNVPQISGSMGFSPTLAQNYIVSPLLMRGPVSSSTWSISNNILIGNVNIGSSAVNNAEKLVSGLTLSTNTIPGTLNVIANQVNLTSSANISTNTIGGGATLNLNSSSVTFTNNIIADTSFTLTNNFYSGSLGLGAARANRNLIIGSSNTMLATGISDAVVTQAAFDNNIIGGISNTLFINATSASTNNQLNNTIIYGNTLIVTGSSNTSTTFGGAFFGRYNANDGRRNSTAGTIFAVGTGTAATAASRKTGFLIDSGSNTFVEGTFNVSGSSSFTGSVTISGSLLVNGNSVSIDTGSFATTGSNSFNGNQRITGSLTMSGSILFVDRSGNNTNTYLGLNALGMGLAGAQPLALGNTISIAIGQGAMRFASGSSQNVAIGNNALLLTSGSNNFALGSEAMANNITGTDNVAIGLNGLNSNTTGTQNVAIGNNAGFRNNGGSNTYIGDSAGYNITGSNNTIVGRYQGSTGQSFSNNIILADGQGNVKAQYSGSAWSFQDEIKLNVGANKPAGQGSATTDGAGLGTFTNSLITTSSIVLLSSLGSYSIWGGACSAGSMVIASSLGSSGVSFNYLIINPTA